MTFGFGPSDVITISTLAVKVITAYKDAPGEYKNISEEVKSLHIIINRGVQHLESIPLCEGERQEGMEILQGCQSVLEDLDALIEKYKGFNKRQVFARVKIGMEDITTLRTRLISNTTLLNSFIQSYSQVKIESSQTRMEGTQLDIQHSLLEMKADLNDFFCCQRRPSAASSESVSSFTMGSLNSRRAYKELCRELHQIGVRADTIKRKEGEVISIFRRASIAGRDIDTGVKGGGQAGDAKDKDAIPIPASADSIFVGGGGAIQYSVFGLVLGMLVVGAWNAGFLPRGFS